MQNCGFGKAVRCYLLCSEERDPKGNLRKDFEEANEHNIATSITCQFGPKNRRTRDDYSDEIQFKQDRNTIKLRSVEDGKGLPDRQTGENGLQKYGWGLENSEQFNTKTTDARFRRLEEELVQLRKETMTRQQQTEHQQQTVIVTVMDTPIHGPIIIKRMTVNC